MRRFLEKLLRILRELFWAFLLAQLALAICAAIVFTVLWALADFWTALISSVLFFLGFQAVVINAVSED